MFRIRESGFTCQLKIERTVHPWFREKHGEPNHLKSPKAKGKKDSEAGETVKIQATPPPCGTTSLFPSIKPKRLGLDAPALVQKMGKEWILQETRNPHPCIVRKHLSPFPAWYQPLKSVQTIRSPFTLYPPDCIQGEHIMAFIHHKAVLHPQGNRQEGTMKDWG